MVAMMSENSSECCLRKEFGSPKVKTIFPEDEKCHQMIISRMQSESLHDNSLYTLFIQPYNEGMNQCSLACKDKATPLLTRITQFALGVSLLIPPINTVALAILRFSFEQTFASSQEEVHFSEKDMDLLTKTHFGLRHVSTRGEKPGMEVAIDECDNGVKLGCSLSLAPQLSSFKDLSSGERLASFEKGVDAFISGCLDYDICNYGIEKERNATQDSRYTIDQLVNNWHFNGGFLTVKYEWEQLPSDLNVWGKGLGRIAKRNIPANDLRNLSVSTVKYSKEASKQLVAPYDKPTALLDSVQARMVASIRKSLIESIRAQKE